MGKPEQMFPVGVAPGLASTIKGPRTVYLEITKAEFEALPFREDVEGDYETGARYRAKGDPNGLYEFVGTPREPRWNCFSVHIVGNPQ